MEKLGVLEEEDGNKTAEKAVERTSCPKCNTKLAVDVNVKKCPNCGTAPFEGA